MPDGTSGFCYDKAMKKILFILGVTLLASPVLAYEVLLTEVQKPYEVVDIDIDIDERQTHLGTLEDFPVMYQFKLSEDTAFNVSLRQLYQVEGDPIPFGLILVKQDRRGGGVTEIARFNPQNENWTRIKDGGVGLTFWQSDIITQQLDDGVYRLEVSTPVNIGKYVLDLGQPGESSGYFEAISNARTIQSFYGYSALKMLTSSLIYYPIGIVILLYLIRRTWQYRKVIANGS